MAELAVRLEPYLLLARSTKGPAAAKVVMDATAAAGVYVFAELLELPNIQDLASDAGLAKYLALLQLFAYGTLDTYGANTAAYPPLSPAHFLKLKHLTLVSLALQHRSIPYDRLLSELQVQDVRQLEDLIIDVIYAGLLGGKMHHHERVLHVDWVAGRDLTEQDLLRAKEGLQNWCRTAENLLSALDNRIKQVKYDGHVEAQESAEYRDERDRLFFERATESARGSSGNTDGNGSGSIWGPGAGNAVTSAPFGDSPNPRGSGRRGRGGMKDVSREGREEIMAVVGGEGRISNLTRETGERDDGEGRRSKRTRD